MAPLSLSSALSDVPSHDSTDSHLHPDLLDSSSLFPGSQNGDHTNDDWTTTAAAVAAVQAAQEASQSNHASNSHSSFDSSSLLNVNGLRQTMSAPVSRSGSASGSKGNSPPILQPRLPNQNDQDSDMPPPPKKTRKRSSAGTKAQRALIIEEGMPAEYEDPTGDFRTGVIYVHATPSTPQACMRCHAIKRKCDNERPRCTGCAKADEPCAYEMNPATSRFVNNLKDEQHLTELKLERTSREKDERIAQLERFILQMGHSIPPRAPPVQAYEPSIPMPPPPPSQPQTQHLQVPQLLHQFHQPQHQPPTQLHILQHHSQPQPQPPQPQPQPQAQPQPQPLPPTQQQQLHDQQKLQDLQQQLSTQQHIQLLQQQLQQLQQSQIQPQHQQIQHHQQQHHHNHNFLI